MRAGFNGNRVRFIGEWVIQGITLVERFFNWFGQFHAVFQAKARSKVTSTDIARNEFQREHVTLLNQFFLFRKALDEVGWNAVINQVFVEISLAASPFPSKWSLRLPLSIVA